MKIVMRDGRVFQGTALQIVKAMQDIAFGVEDFTVPKYIEWVIANARKFEEVELDVKGGTDEELAASLVAEMLRTGLTRRMSAIGLRRPGGPKGAEPRDYSNRPKRHRKPTFLALLGARTEACMSLATGDETPCRTRGRRCGPRARTRRRRRR